VECLSGGGIAAHLGHVSSGGYRIYIGVSEQRLQSCARKASWQALLDKAIVMAGCHLWVNLPFIASPFECG
jgi:hypothetical protein